MSSLIRLLRNRQNLQHPLAILAFCFLIFFSVRAAHAETQVPAWVQVLPTCSKTWSGKIRNNEHRYNFKQDNSIQSYSDFIKNLDRKNCKKEWTVLIFMAADNDLTPYAFWDVYEMEAGFKHNPSPLRSDVLVELDTTKGDQSRRLHIFNTPEIYDPTLEKSHFEAMEESDIRSPVVELLPETESASQKLKSFLSWGIKNYPAENYMVVVWGHGQGWTSGAPPEKPATSSYLTEESVNFGLDFLTGRAPENNKNPFSHQRFGGLAFDDAQGTYLDIPSLHTVLKEVTANSLEGNLLSVYASDACLMQMLEVSSEISDVTRFTIGSTQVQNFLGLPYRRLFYELNKGSFNGERKKIYGPNSKNVDEPYLMALMVPTLFESSFKPGGLQHKFAKDGIETITMSSVNSSVETLLSLLPELEKFSAAMVDYIREDSLRAGELQFLMQNAPSFQGGAQDIGVFLSLLKMLLKEEADFLGHSTHGAANLLQSTYGVEDALNRAILNRTLGTRYKAVEGRINQVGFKAVSVWLPISKEDYTNRINDFLTSRFYQETNWNDWLKLLF